MSTREALERSRRLLKRDHNRIVEEINKLNRSTATLEVVEQLDTLRLSLQDTKTKLDDMYFQYMGVLDLSVDADAKLDDELMKDRDIQFLNIDRAVSVCNAGKRKFEGQSKRDSLNASMLDVSASVPSPARLPKINVPTFNGDFRKFLDFKALYENLVHNDDNIPSVRKMHYLKESLIGDAGATLANLSVSEDGYKEAWSRVIAKYDNKRLIIHTHFNDLFSAERLKSESGLRMLVDKFDNAIRGLRICNQTPDQWSPILAYMLYTRLDVKTRNDFDNQATDTAGYITFKSLFKFCENRSHNIEARRFEEAPPATTAIVKASVAKAEKKSSFLAAKSNCIACKEMHLLIECPVFKAHTSSERLQMVRANKMCVNCFVRSHSTAGCTSPKRCKTCTKMHHTLLHLDQAKIPVAPATVTQPQVSEATSTVAAKPGNAGNEPKFSSNVSSVSHKNFVLLPSAVVRFEANQVYGTARILLDDCSQPTLVSDAMVRKYKLPTIKNPSADPIHGIGFGNVRVPRVCKLKLKSRFNSFEIIIHAEVIPAAAIRYAVNSVSWGSCPESFKKIKQLNLADPAFYKPTPFVDQVDVLLGAEFSEICKINETVRIDHLTLRNTYFRWTLIGSFPSDSPTERSCFMTTNPVVRQPDIDAQDIIVNIDAQIYRFWELENVGEPHEQPMANDHCEEHFVQHTTRADDGKFVVKLPFISSPSLLAPNCNVATRILIKGERKRNPELTQHYAAFMAEYESLSHMTRVNPTGKGYFIPHLAVFKPSSTTTQVRVVFNASSTTSSNYSLNDILAVGPILQPDLFSALVRFRSYLIVFTADISKMYRCVWVHPDDRRYQKIVWREQPNQPISEFELNTITYGTASASYLATRCLKAIADEVRAHSPMAAQAIECHFYMDDLLTGCDSIQGAIHLRSTIHSALQSAGFELRKYQSNAVEVLADLPETHVEKKSVREFCNFGAISILGLYWEPESDALRIRTEVPQLPSPAQLTKRIVLSEVSKVFDPLGLASPFTIRAKLFLQKVWQEGISWDQPVSPELAQEVYSYFDEFTELSKFSIPRPYTVNSAVSKCLIGFCDASDKAYCAAVYFRQVDSAGRPSCQLVCAKTRVAPLKALTIPRLELQGALLLTELMLRILKILSIDQLHAYLFCDSSVVLAWIAKPDKPWDVFVRNRVQKIVAQFPHAQWSYVRSKDNPADLGTRRVPAVNLTNSNLWVSGPPFLFLESFFRDPELPHDFNTDMESKRVVKVAHQVTVGAELSPWIDRFSSYKRLLAVLGRVIQWARRWRMTRSTKDKYSYDTSLSACLVSARTAAIRILQESSFSAELVELRSSRPVPAKSPLRQLDPFIDESGVIRVGGRLQNSNLSYQKKHPIVIPNGCQFLKIYADYVHVNFCHANRDFVLRFILAEFYPLGGLAKLVKSRLRKCVICLRSKATTYTQIMGPLPAARVTISRPFSHTGVDFCGPFTAKCVAHRVTKFQKMYACIFVCLTTRAVHIEAASDLSSVVFLMALYRFIARRGLPAVMYSDQGTNFVGASNYLNLTEEEVQRATGERGIEWRFNPARCPHRGGLWEAAVKSAKTHLQRVLGQTALNFEEYSTIFASIESMLNSRPLCYQRSTSDAEDLVLTPSHFLLGESSHQLPEPEDCTVKLPAIARYNQVRAILNGFWKVWRADYLNMLQRRDKWTTRKEDAKIGQVVLLKLPTPPTEWPLAKIVAIHPDVEGKVRTVSVLSKESVKVVDVRSLVKLSDEDEP